MTSKRTGRPRTGTVVPTSDGRLQVIVTLADGKTRKRLDPLPKGTSEAMAREKAAYFAEKYSTVWPEKEPVPPELAENTAMADWFKAWIADRVARGHTSTRDNAAHYRLHVVPSIGSKHVKDWTRDDLRKLSRDLDAKVQANELSWKSAGNVWGTVTKMCDDAAESKHDRIRCRSENPATGVRGPDRGDDVGLQWLYPSEFMQFVECQEVPVAWRRLAALAVYLYPRDAELRVLECTDVDVEHLSLKITKALNRRTGETKSTKGRRRRVSTLEPAIVPLVAAVKVERNDEGLLVPSMPSFRDMARGLRRWLWKAGVRRTELHKPTPTTRPLRFHDLRATGCTWMAVRGDDPLKIQQRAGHTEFETTQRYIRLAESIREGFGDPFPRLPPELYETTGEVSIRSFDQEAVSVGSFSAKQRGGRDSNPRPPA